MRQGKNYKSYQLKSIYKNFEYFVTAIRENPYNVLITHDSSLIEATKQIKLEIDTEENAGPLPGVE